MTSSFAGLLRQTYFPTLVLCQPVGGLRNVCHRRTLSLAYGAEPGSQPVLRHQGTRRVRRTRCGCEPFFTLGNWGIVRAIADGLERSYVWQGPVALRLRFILDFAYSTGLLVPAQNIKLTILSVDAYI